MLINFEPISFSQYQKDFPTNPLETNYPKFQNEEGWFEFWYENLDPSRATNDSAGYDVYAPFDFSLKPNEEITTPTGVKVYIQPGSKIALFILPRSGAGFKCYTRLANTLGLIDGDYYGNSKNEGAIYVKVRNESTDKEWVVKQGEAFCQGVFLPFFTTDRDAEQDKSIRNGGFGSTDKGC
jgi:dUTP pyrophosphatase